MLTPLRVFCSSVVRCNSNSRNVSLQRLKRLATPATPTGARRTPNGIDVASAAGEGRGTQPAKRPVG
eukprot:14873650-Alexandrium_andersonii.AAC.1